MHYYWVEPSFRNPLTCDVQNEGTQTVPYVPCWCTGEPSSSSVTPRVFFSNCPRDWVLPEMLPKKIKCTEEQHSSSFHDPSSSAILLHKPKPQQTLKVLRMQLHKRKHLHVLIDIEPHFSLSHYGNSHL